MSFRWFVVILLWLSAPHSLSHGQEAAAPSAKGPLSLWLEGRELNDQELASLQQQPFASQPLSRDEATQAEELLWFARLQFLRNDRRAEVDAREITIGELKMPFWYKVFGDEPATGRSLFISMHGGGGAPAAVNDQQYENQKRLYQPAEGIYLVPRAATDTWDLWHQAHIDDFFERLITDMIAIENVNPDRVYIMGYSAGGDGVYQLAPRMADRLAAASMMAGHPNEARPEGLRNIGFTIHMGAQDSAYKRNSIAGEWKKKLAALHTADPEGYVHEVTIHEGRGHWMNLQDAVAVPWMAKFDRNPWPRKVHWVQDDVRHSQFYWLQVDKDSAKAGDEVVANVVDNTVTIEKCSAKQLTLLLSDRLLNLDKPVTVVRSDGSQINSTSARTARTIAESMQSRSDNSGLHSATVTIEL